MTSREAFEAHFKDYYVKRGFISSKAEAEVFWQAAIQHARDVAVKACEEMPTEIDGGFCEWAQGIDFASKRCADAIKEALK